MSDNNTVFIAADNKRLGLEAVAQDVFAALGITESEERFSSNYPPNEHYFAGYAENVVIDVFDFDEIKAGYIYSLSVDKPTYRKGKKHAPTSAATIAEMLTKAGFRVFVPIGSWHKDDWDGNGKKYAL